MNKEKFSNLIVDPTKLEVGHIKELESLIKKYPYFQAARALYLKLLKNTESATYNHQLKTTAAYTTDRSILFDYIVSEDFNQNAISEVIKRNSDQVKQIEVHDVDDISVNKSVAIDDALKQQIRDTEGVLDPELFKRKIDPHKVAHLEPAISDQKEVGIRQFSSSQKAEEKLELGKPLSFNRDEKHSFAEWLKLTPIKPIKRSETTTELEKKKSPPPEQEKKMELIDRFLEKNPKIVPNKEYTPKPLVHSEEIMHQGLMTETLARIYLEQKNYDKAIQSYKILSLKYPEKSSFFADQIKAVKELQERNNP